MSNDREAAAVGVAGAGAGGMADFAAGMVLGTIIAGISSVREHSEAPRPAPSARRSEGREAME
jgi:hypothetical protein